MNFHFELVYNAVKINLIKIGGKTSNFKFNMDQLKFIYDNDQSYVLSQLIYYYEY